MTNNLAIVGLSQNELSWIRILISLLRHPDPEVPELSRQALLFLGENAGNGSLSLLNGSLGSQEPHKIGNQATTRR